MNAPEPFSVTEGSSGLRVRKLRKSYRRRPVIRDVSLELNRGEVVALLGPNGSGKTTSFYCIAGLITPDGGTVTIDGQDVTLYPMYRRARAGIGYLPQEMSIFRGLSVEDNIMAILEVVERKRAAPQGAAGGTAGGVFDRASAPRARLVAVRRGTAPRRNRALPGLQPALRAAGRALRRRRSDRGGRHPHLVSDLKTRGIGVLITDHNVRETLEIVDRAYILHDGTIIMSGTADEVVRDENVRRVYLGQSFRIT
jgi:lipopolysaccharide export system ATP-binding protein